MNALILAVAAVVPYLPALKGASIFDDYHAYHDPVMDRLAERRWSTWLHIERLVTRLTFYFTRRGGPIAQHGFNLAVHALNVQLVYALGWSLIGTEKGFLVALVFAVHSLQVMAVGYVSARPSLLAFFFAALVANFLVGGFLWGGVESAALFSWLVAVSALLLLALLGAASKEEFLVYLSLIAFAVAWNSLA